MKYTLKSLAADVAHFFTGDPDNSGQQTTPDSSYNGGTSTITNWHGPARTELYDGEKTIGELGPLVNLIPDYNGLRLRAYQQYLKSDIVRIIVGKYFKWTIGSGLELQAEPSDTVLKSEGIKNSNLKEFIKLAEARFKIYSNSKEADFCGMVNLHKLAAEAHQTAFLGGDCLAVLRVEKGRLKMQNYDGQLIQSPPTTDPAHEVARKLKNKIVHGIEIDERGAHVAFYVHKDNNIFGDYVRISARSESTGLLMAWMVYSGKYRINHVRGVSQLAAVLEKVDKLDRYTEATVGSAEERAKIPFFIEHSRYSDGENPLGAKLKAKIGGNAEVDTYAQGELLSHAVAATTAKTVHNMPVGSKLNAIQTQNEIQYEPFFRAVFNQICASMDIPPEVAMQLYNSNYSASRAAINGWEYIVKVNRKGFADDYYQPFYNVWLALEIIANKIPAEGYLQGLIDQNIMVVNSYTNAKFLGANMPHIDPLKEIKAVREMLGDMTKGIMPLISAEQATEILGLGDWIENYKKWEEEQKSLPKVEPPVPPAGPAAPPAAAKKSAAAPAKKEDKK